MSIRRTGIGRVNEARKSSVPTIGKGKPLDGRGNNGDLTFRRTSDGLKLYIKANGKWHGVKVGESFDDLEKVLNELKTKVSTIKKSKSPTDTLTLTYDDSNYATLQVQSDGHLQITGTGSDDDFTMDFDGDIVLDSLNDVFKFEDNGTTRFAYTTGALLVYGNSGSGLEFCNITVQANGVTNIGTSDQGSTVGHMTLSPDGDLILDPVSQKVIINATDGLYFDGGGDTYIYEVSGDIVRYIVGGDILMIMTEKGTSGNNIEFRDSSVGFQRDEATFSATGIIGSGGSDDTDIDFRFTNKYRLEMTADIHTMNLIFPGTSGNFLLVCTTDGDHDVSNWNVFESDASAATTATVMWAGGSVPAFTSSGIDIVSFY